ncbi:MAG: (2Fe-2S)-binding protein [Myxococcota bacterium]|jgi:carbon-monoxide dehydrogenase small subunit|nr:(2Fe-2S)-binding protein [Myxococcota bacterium]
MSLRINQREVQPTEEQASKSLLDYLRDELGLTGTKIGCRKGICGSCVVLVDEKAVRACRTPLRKLLDAEGDTQVRTIEALRAPDGALHPIQQAFIDAGAIQCGYCTPGMVMSSVALLHRNPKPTREQIRQGLAGNLCRCTGYQQIIDAVALASERMESADEGE